jgi:formate hydrogenlyase transcriptional activator
VAHSLWVADAAPLGLWSGEDIASGQAGEIEGRLRRFDGKYRWFLFPYEPLRDDASNVVNWYGTNTDIDDLKRAEQKLRESEEEFHRMTDAIPQAMTVLSPDGTVLYANRVALEQTGLTLDEVRKQSFLLAAFHPEDIDTLRAKRDAGFASGEPFELDLRQMRKRDGQHQWRLVQYNAMRDEQGRVIRWYAIATDIQRQKAEEERLRNENVALREEIGSSMCGAHAGPVSNLLS